MFSLLNSEGFWSVFFSKINFVLLLSRTHQSKILKKTFTFLLFFITFLSFSQSVIYKNEKVFDIKNVDVKPEFVGGMKGFYDFLAKNYKMPDLENYSGKVIVNFVIEKDGAITEIEVVSDIGYGTGKEAIRVLGICPKWKPAVLDGEKVRTLYTFPINLKSSADE